jgi:hypothetical protein
MSDSRRSLSPSRSRRPPARTPDCHVSASKLLSTKTLPRQHIPQRSQVHLYNRGDNLEESGVRQPTRHPRPPICIRSAISSRLAVLAVHLLQAVSSRDSCAGCKSSIVLRVCCALNTVTQPLRVLKPAKLELAKQTLKILGFLWDKNSLGDK